MPLTKNTHPESNRLPLDWWQNQRFIDFQKKFDDDPWLHSERRWMLAQLLRLCESIEGHTAECGVYRGASSFIICANNEISGSRNRVHHIFDSFEGLSEPDTIDGEFWKRGDLAVTQSQVEANLACFSKKIIYPGWIPERFNEIKDLSFCFVHIDVDLYQPTLDSLEFFYPRMSAGGIIVCDDFGFESCKGATNAVDQFFAGKTEKMIPLSSGGAFMIKSVSVGNSCFG